MSFELCKNCTKAELCSEEEKRKVCDENLYCQLYERVKFRTIDPQIPDTRCSFEDYQKAIETPIPKKTYTVDIFFNDGNHSTYKHVNKIKLIDLKSSSLLNFINSEGNRYTYNLAYIISFKVMEG